MAADTALKNFQGRCFPDTVIHKFGRPPNRLVVGQEVLVVTCPVLADELLHSKLRDRIKDLVPEYNDILLAFGRNPVQGVVRGVVTEIGETAPIGLQKISAAVSAESVIATAAALKDANKPRDDFYAQYPWMTRDSGASFEVMMLKGLGGELKKALVSPWLEYTRLTDIQRATATLEPESALAIDLAVEGVGVGEEGDAARQAIAEKMAAGATRDEAFAQVVAKMKKPKFDLLYLVFAADGVNESMLKNAFEDVLARVRKEAIDEVNRQSGYL